MSLQPKDIDYVLLTHLDCDHVSGLSQLAGAKNIICAKSEKAFAYRHLVRYTPSMWKNTGIKGFRFKKTGIGPVGKSYDLFKDGSVLLVNIPGHSAGLFAVLVKNDEGKFVLLYSDGGYASASWRKMIRPGISSDPEKQMKSLEWIKMMSEDARCVESIANHDSDVKPHIICL